MKMRLTIPVCLLLALVAGLVPAQDARPRFPLTSTDECFKCHFTPAANPAADPFAESRDFCNVEAAATWLADDKHRQSLALILTGPGRELTERIVGEKIETLLRFDLSPSDAAAPGALAVRNVRFADPPAEGEARNAYGRGVATLRQCFACHAPVEERQVGAAKRTTIENGVSCQACHGAGLAYEAPHQKPLWRLVKASDKETEFGLRDLRNPATRAALCASCHVGTKSQQWGLAGENVSRFVRHEWYAKGHPPLPGLEFVTFAAHQPAHWRTIQEKLLRPEGFRYYAAGADAADADEYLRFVLRTDRIRLAGSYREANPGSFSPEPERDMARAKEVLVSGLGTLGTYAALVRDAADDEGTWPDFALYDCGACHHELASNFPSATRVRRNLTPGRPPPAFWTFSLARLGAKQAEMDIEPDLADLDAAFSARPLGDRELVRSAADKLSIACTDASRALAAQPLDREAASALLTRLAHPQHDVERDYHAARQTAWAIREVLKDLAGVPHRNYALLGPEIAPPPESIVPQPLVELLGGIRGARSAAEYEQLRARIDGLFDAAPAANGEVNWHPPLRLRLPAGQRQQVLANLPAWLDAIAAYDPAFFQMKLKPIQAAFPQAK
jgi:hypothetical protein